MIKKFADAVTVKFHDAAECVECVQDAYSFDEAVTFLNRYATQERRAERERVLAEVESFALRSQGHSPFAERLLALVDSLRGTP